MCNAEEVAEESPITFKSVAEAVTFADGLLIGDSDKVKGVLTPGKPGKVPLSELRDIASTISVEAARIKFPAGHLFRFVHGRYTHTLDLADHLAHRVWNGPGDGPVASRKTIAMCRQLANIGMLDFRQREQHGRGFPTEQVAKAMNARSRQQFYEQWAVENSAIRAAISQLLKQAEAELEIPLRRLGVLE